MNALRLRILLTGFALFYFAGCKTPPPVSEMPTVSPLPERIAPANEMVLVEFEFPVVGTDKELLAENITFRKDFQLPENASVVISVPVADQNLNGPNTNGPKQTGFNFRTTGYFNIMEQQIEKQLLRRGLTVVDRAKFEAILREQRKGDSAGSGGATVDKMELYREGKLELIDSAELIRAAQSPELQADYIFQVNDFATEPSRDEIINLSGRPELIEAASRHPGLGKVLLESGYSEITKPGFYSSINAKIIRVDNGSIEWVGSHRVDTQNVQSFTMKLPFVKYAVNVERINNEIDAWNASLKRKLNEVRQLKMEADRLIESKANRGFGLGESKHAEIVAAVDRYDIARIELEQMKQALPEAWDRDWMFAYSMSTQPIIEPLLPSANRMAEIEIRFDNAETEEERKDISAEASQMQDLIGRHVSKLSQLAVAELINATP